MFIPVSGPVPYTPAYLLSRNVFCRTIRSTREIAEYLRFSAPSHFAKVFREVTGRLPPGISERDLEINILLP